MFNKKNEALNEQLYFDTSKHWVMRECCISQNVNAAQTTYAAWQKKNMSTVTDTQQ